MGLTGVNMARLNQVNLTSIETTQFKALIFGHSWRCRTDQSQQNSRAYLMEGRSLGEVHNVRQSMIDVFPDLMLIISEDAEQLSPADLLFAASII